MALLPQLVVDNLRGQNFIDEFNQNPEVYLDLVRLFDGNVRDTLTQAHIPIAGSLEEFAENFLLRNLASAFLSDFFSHFREALSRRIYIAPVEERAWARLMARYVLHQAIVTGVLR